MAYIDEQLLKIKEMIEKAILEGGIEKKNRVIKSSKPINKVHDAVKKSFIDVGIDPNLICPRFEDTRGELTVAGFLKPKKQDICVCPKSIEQKRTPINWGTMRYLNREDEHGYNFSTQLLVINVRSQLSSMRKNYDTLFERTLAEAQNLHMRYPGIVLGEVYMIPTRAYDDKAAKMNQVAFSNKCTDIAMYISFFSEINARKYYTGEKAELENIKNAYMYERCALLIVDFDREQPKLYRNSAELKQDGLIPENFELEYENISFETFASDLKKIYAERFDVNNLILSE